MRLSAGNGGWCLASDAGAPAVFVRFVDVDGRLRVGQLYWSPDGQPISADRLRALRLGQIEAMANAAEMARSIRARMDLPGPDLARLASHYATTFGRRPDHWVAESMRAQINGSGVELPKYGEVPTTGTSVEPLPPLRVPHVPGKKPDDFYVRVAATYTDLTGKGSRRPAVDLAEKAGVQISTAHRWIKEARRRGFLAPGRKGKGS